MFKPIPVSRLNSGAIPPETTCTFEVHFYMSECKVAQSSAFSIEATEQSEENDVLLQEILLLGDLRPNVYRRGLQVIVTQWARKNAIQVTNLTSMFHRAIWGASGYIEFSGHAMENTVQIKDTYFIRNYALRGGGIVVFYRNFATQNTFKVYRMDIFVGFTELGGGVYLILQDSSRNYTIQFTQETLHNNTALCGGGMLIQIKDVSVANMAVIENSKCVCNKLLPLGKYDMMGGGVHLGFTTFNANFQTNNRVSFTEDEFAFNSAGQGVGGSMSVLYKHSLYPANNGD